MDYKFAAVIAGIITVMGVLIAFPNLNQQPNTDQVSDFKIEYSKQRLVRSEAGSLAASSAELLTIDNSGLAAYSTGQSPEKQMQLSREEFGRIKGLILETGFMQIPRTDYLQKEGLSEFTKYTLRVTAEGSQKTVNWVDAASYEGTIPPIISNVGLQLDSVIAKFG